MLFICLLFFHPVFVLDRRTYIAYPKSLTSSPCIYLIIKSAVVCSSQMNKYIFGMILFSSLASPYSFTLK
jgi:hypothetical protein